MKKNYENGNWLDPLLKKICRVMKLTTLIILISIMHVSATVYSQATKLSLNMQETTIKEVLHKIESLSEFRFIYQNEQVDLNKRINVQFKGERVENILDELFEGEEIEYSITSNNLILIKSRKNQVRKNVPNNVVVQQKTVSGKVTDSTGQPLPGVTVVVKGTTQGTITDTNGKFSLADIPENATLQFSFVGMIPQDIKVENKTTIDVTMEVDAIGIEEVVAVGYGTQKATKITGAISNIKIGNLDTRPVTNISQALSGAASGIQVTQNSGAPGQDGAQIRIRGVGTLTESGQEPLILVDGIASTMRGLDPNDIESISVLKDAASAAIYGSRAANGVVLINTKKGEKGKPIIKYSGYFGVQSPTRRLNLISDMATHMELLNEAKSNLGIANQFPQSVIDEYKSNNALYKYPNTDWYDYFYGSPKPIQQHNVAASGGTDNLLYNISLGYLNQEGMAGQSTLDRYTLRVNNELKLNDRLKINSNISGYWEKLNGPTNVEGIINDLATSPGIVPKANGKFGGPQTIGEGNAGNPLANFASRDDKETRQYFLAKLSLEYKFSEKLKFQTNGGIRYENYSDKHLNWPYTLWDFQKDEVSVYPSSDLITLKQGNSQLVSYTSYSTLNYENTFSEDHYISLLFGQSAEFTQREEFSGYVEDVYSIYTPVLSSGISSPSVGGNLWEIGLLSFFGRINYDYKEKYLLEANVRFDASSRFKKEHRWGMFPSFSAGWRVSKEDFFPTNNIVNDLKIRGSWGRLGNQSIGSNYPYQALYNINQNYNFNNQVVSGIAQTDLANDRIKWETTESVNLGFDVGLFKNRFTTYFDWFNKMTDDILVQLPIPTTMGAKAAPYQNVGKVKNWGWDLEMAYRQNFKDFNFRIGANVSQIENKVVKFKGDESSINNEFIIQEGLPYQSLYGYKVTGIFQTNEEVAQSAVQHSTYTAPGDLKYEDFKNDGVINADDRQVIGNTIPKFYYGFNFNFEYKDFDLSAIFQGIAKVDRYLKENGVYPFAVHDRGLTPESWINRWTSENPSTTMPRLTIKGDYPWNYATSNFWVQNGAYLRLKNIQLGYTLPKKLSNNIGIKNLRVYVSGQNILTFTKYKGYDPESLSTQTEIGYPISKVYSTGLQINF